jgi:DNA-binding LytR/AlgR family response regulator
MKYRCIIVDHEPLAIEVIRAHAGTMGIFDIVAGCSNATEAFRFLSEGNIDLMFLDIQMPGMRGTDFLRSMANPPAVILTTAYRDYAFEAYELNVIDYLLKPISFERFLKAIDKFTVSVPLKAGIRDDKRYIYLNINKKVHKILTDEIDFIESIKDYITIHTASGDIVAKHTLSSFEELLPDDEFVRIHRSFIVSIGKIKSFNSHSLEIGKKELPIGQNYQEALFKKLKYPKNRIQ